MAKNCSEIIETVSTGVWFKNVPVEGVERLAARATLKSYEPHQFLYMLGEVPDHVFCVVEGSICISLSSSNGQQFMLALLYPGYWFG